MHVVATAGHVDHGKSTLVRALTGMEPDRWAEERRRGMTIDLGFAWTTLPKAGQVAFVDVPGHERFVPNMLAGVGPVPAVLLVVAADAGWMPQTAEHVDALTALQVGHGLIAVTRTDLVTPGRPAEVLADVAERLAGTSLAGLPGFGVSAPDGRGLAGLRAGLERLAAGLPPADPAAPVRLWVDRAFTVRGAGTVITGTLPAGTLSAGDELELFTAARGLRTVRVRGLQALGRPADRVRAVARVAVNLRGVDVADVRRGDLLRTPAPSPATDLADVELADTGHRSAADLVLHLGSAAVPARVRRLDAGRARLRLGRPLPLEAGDVGLLRDPGRRRILGRVLVLDAAPPPLGRRGAAAARAAELTAGPAADLLRRRGIVRAAELRGAGASPPADAIVAGDWLVDAGVAARLRTATAAAVAAWTSPLEPGPRIGDLARDLTTDPTLGAVLPPGPAGADIVAALVPEPLRVRDGRVVDPSAVPELPGAVAAAVAEVRTELAAEPFAAPDAGRLAGLGLGRRELAAAERAGALLRVSDGIVLLPGADVEAAGRLAALPQPFTLSQAREALRTSRRVAVPLLELLDRRRLTRRLPDDRRTVVSPGSAR